MSRLFPSYFAASKLKLSSLVRLVLWPLLGLNAFGARAQQTQPVLGNTTKAIESKEKITAPVPYVFAYFVGNGEDGLHLAWSRDGYQWSPLGGGKSYLTPTVGESKLMRDPCILQGPDGTFHMVWTTSWEGKTIGYASSKDLVHWSPQKSIEVMKGNDGTLNCWAPEISYDDAKKQFVIFWASTVTGKFNETLGQAGAKYNHRIYSATTKDFQNFTPAKVMFDPGYIVIDSTILHANGKYRMIYKDETETPPKKNLRVATSANLEGPYTEISEPFTGKEWVEGPTAIKVGDWYVAYYDVYGKGRYEASRTKDFKNWEDVSARIALPKGVRHGTAIPVSKTILEPLVNAPLQGKVGVATWETQAEFKDIKVTQDGKTLFDSNAATGVQPKTIRGQWEFKDGVLRQSSAETNTQALFGDPTWSNYTLTLKARKTGGKEGFLIKFLSPDDETASWWNLGGWGNTKDSLELGGFPQAQSQITIDNGRWYDIRLEQNASTVKAFLDGKLIHEVTAPKMPVDPPVPTKLPWTNPIVPQRADPHVNLHSDGYYYLTATVPEYDRIEVRRAKTLAGLSTATVKTVWTKHASGPMSYHIWAPEIHWINGKWYIYFAAGKAESIWDIRMYVLENGSKNPLEGEWTEKRQIKMNWESFTLDATTFVHKGTRYLAWAQSVPDVAGTSIFIAKMDTPWSITGKQVLITKPDLPWERVGHNVNEAPAFLERNGKVFMTYSASATDANYCLGMLTADGNADLLNPTSWKKSPVPVFASSDANSQYGPGHNAFTTTPDGKTDILVYHSRSYKQIQGEPLYNPDRATRAQIIQWKADGTPDFGVPVADSP